MHPSPPMFLFGTILILVLPSPSLSESYFNYDEFPSISIVILQTNLLVQPATSGGARLQVTWVLTSDMSDGSASIDLSLLVSCPEFRWDDTVLTSPDSFPNTHCGGMFSTELPLSAGELAAGAHSLRLTLADPPASSFISCSPSPCIDIVSIHIQASPSTSALSFTVDDHLEPGGIPKIFHRLWLSPPALQNPRPIPSTYQRYWQTWRQLHEPRGWRFVTWTAANLGRLVAAGEARHFYLHFFFHLHHA